MSKQYNTTQTTAQWYLKQLAIKQLVDQVEAEIEAFNLSLEENASQTQNVGE